MEAGPFAKKDFVLIQVFKFQRQLARLFDFADIIPVLMRFEMLLSCSDLTDDVMRVLET